MSRISKLIWALLLAGVAAMAAAETVYKWVDAGGQVHYTDLPPRQGDAKILGVYQQESGDVQDQASGDDNGNYAEEGGDDDSDAAQPTSSNAHTPEPPPSDQAMAAAEQDAAKAKVEQCKQAKERYQRYLDSRRLYRETDGKREYLTDKELTEARARAKQAVDDYCS